MSGGYPDQRRTHEVSEFECGKHFKADRRAKRFDPDHKHGCLQGRTSQSKSVYLWGRSKWRSAAGDFANEMEVQRPESDGGVALSALDLMTDRPDLLTSTPVKQGLTDELCEELEILCSASTIRRHPENPDYALRIFELPVVGLRAGTEIVKEDCMVQLLAAPTKIHPGAEPTPFVTFMSCTPQDILEQTLLKHAKLSWSGCVDLPSKRLGRSKKSTRPQKAAVRYPSQKQVNDVHFASSCMNADCWIQDLPEDYLEVDLGSNCNVTHVSTLGRFPPMMVYPPLNLQRQWEREAGEDAKPSRHWTVVNPASPDWEQWVVRYELEARLESGRSWDAIATLKGNSDMTSEVSHNLREICHNPDGLQCRYLRFRPTSFHGKAAMRIGIYGVSLDPEVHKQEQAKKEEETIKYILPVPLANRNQRRHLRDFVSRRRYSPDWYGKYGGEYKISTRRVLRMRATKAEFAEATGGTKTLLRLSSGTSNCDEPEETDQVADTDVQGSSHEQPQLERVVSRRVEEALGNPPPLVRTRTDENRGYYSEPEDLEVEEQDWEIVEEALTQPPSLVRTRTDEERGYCSEPEDLVIDMAEWSLL